MDFKLILLLLGLGQLVVVILYALWGFLGGLKRELKCTAVLLILLLLGWLIFSDPALMMGIKIPGALLSMASSLGISGETASIWEVVLQVLQAQLPYGKEVFVAGHEAYELAYDVVAGALRGVGLIVITLATFYLAGLIRLVSHIVKLIVTAVKKAKAKKNPVEEVEEAPVEEEPEQVVVLQGLEGADDVVVTTDENELPAPKPITQRIWGGVVGLVKACVVLCIMFVPLSGVVSILDETSDETRELISDLVSGDKKLTDGEESNVVDIVFDFVEDYKSSPLGMVVESTSYFFGDSFSTLLFDQTFYITTDTQRIPVRQELVTFIHAANALEGNIDYKNLEQDKLSNALDELKDSQLLPELMPAVIEFAYEVEQVKELLVAARQEALFLQLRYVNWDKDVETLLDVVKVAYTLDIFAEDFNYLTLDVETVRTIVSLLSQTEFLPKALPIGVQVALKLDAVQQLIKDPSYKPDLTSVDWAKDLSHLVDVYEKFQKLGITSLEGIGKDQILEAIFVNEKGLPAVKDILSSVVYMDLFKAVLAPVAEKIVDAKIAEINNGQFQSLVGVLPIDELSASQWESDLHALVDLADKFYDLDVFTFDINKMDLSSTKAIETFKSAIDVIFGTLGDENSEAKYGLNILRQEDVLLKLIDWALKNFKLVALDADLQLSEATISLPKEGKAIKALIDVYAELVKYEEFSLTGKIDVFGLLEKENMGELIVSALEALVESDIFLNTLVPIIDYQLSPKLSGYEGAEELLDEMLNNRPSGDDPMTPEEFIIAEVIKIVEAVFGARDLGFFRVPKEGLKAIDFAQTEAMKKLVTGLLDCKLFEGFEPRLLAVVFKMAGIEVTAEELANVTFAAEKEALINAIDTLAPILQDEAFKLFNEDNKLVISAELKSLLLSEDGAQTLIDALQYLFGDYEVEGSYGSELVSVLLMPLYNKFLADKVPADFKELVDSLKLDLFTREEISSDIRTLVYVADELVEYGIFGALDGKYGFITVAGNLAMYRGERIIRALAEVNILERRTGEILAFAINYGVGMYNENAAKKGQTQLLIDKLYAKDFENVVWANEVNAAVEAYQALISFCDANSFTQVTQIERFVKEKQYLQAEFLTEENAHLLVDIIEPIAGLQVIPVLVSAAENQIYRTLALQGIDLAPVLDVTNEQLSADLTTIVNVARKVIDLGVLEYVYNKDISSFDYELIASIIYDENGADISDLNILQKSEAKIISELVVFALAKAAPKTDFTITPADLKNADITVDAKHLANIVVELGGVIESLGLESLNDIIEFAKAIKVNELINNRDLVSPENVERISNVLQNLGQMTIVEGVAPVAFNMAVEMLNAKVPGIDALYGSVTGAELAEDIYTLGTFAEEINAIQLTNFITGMNVYAIDEVALADLVAGVLSLNVINNNNVEVIQIAVNYINKFVGAKVKGLEFVVEEHVFANFDSEWAEDQRALGEIVAKLVSIAFHDLNILNMQEAKEFIQAKEFTKVEFYTSDLLTKLGNIAADAISLHTVGALLPSVFNYLVDLARFAVVKGQELGLDFLYILEAYENGELTNEMLAQDVITLVQMAIMALDTNLLELVKDSTHTELTLSDYAPIVEKLAELNILSLDSAKMTTQLVNLAIRLAGQDLQVSEKLFVGLSEEQWVEDAKTLANLLVAAEGLLEELDLATIEDIKAFIANDAKLPQNYLNEHVIDEIVNVAQTALSFNAGEYLITEVVNYALPKLEAKLQAKEMFARIDLEFLTNTISQATLHNDVAVLGEIAKEAINLGVIEYINTKDIKNLDLTPLANIVALLGELNLYTQTRDDWYVNAAIVASDATKKNFILSHEDLAGIDYEEDNKELQAVIMRVDQLLKDNEHDSLSEIIKFATDLGATYEQWATYENGKAVVEILNGLADVDILMACGASTMEYVIYVALTKDIDIRFLYDTVYKGADLGADVKIIASILDEALEFGIIELVYKYPIEKIELSHVQEIVKYVDQLHLFGLAKAEWTSFLAHFIGSKLQMNITVTPESFANVDWAQENAAVVELVGKAAEILAENKFESTTECIKFITEKAYLSNQYVTEENVELIAQVLDVLAKLDVLEQLLPNLVEFGMAKLGTNVEGDFTIVTSKDFETLAYMVREIQAFGAVEIYNNILWNEKYFYEGEFDLSHVINVIEALEDLAILAIDKPHLAQYVASKVNLGVQPSMELLEAVDYSAENAKLVEIVKAIDALMKNTHLTNLEFIYHWIDEKGYQSAQYINDENALLVADLVELVSELQLLVPYAGEALDLAFLKVNQLHYLVGQLEGAQVVEDLQAVANIIRNLVEFETIDLYYYGTTEQFKFDALRNAIDLALNLNILNVKREETMALVLNKALAKFGANYQASEFEGIDWEAEDATILATYDAVVALLQEMNVDNTAMVKAYFEQKLYMLAQYTNETTIGYAVEIIDLVASLQELPIVIDEFALLGLSKVKGLDLSFLSEAIENGELTDDELVADIHKLADIARDYLEYDLYNMIYSNEYKAVDTDKFVEIFVQLDELHVLSEFRVEWTLVIVNKLLGSYGSISEADLDYITDAMWADEIDVLADTIVALYDFLVVRGYADNAEINRLYNELVKEKKYQSKRYLVDLLLNNQYGEKDEASVDALLLAVVKASKSDVAGVVLHKAFGKAVNVLGTKGIDLAKLPQIVSIAELQQDVELFAKAAKDLIMFGTIELVADKGAIDYNNIDLVLNAIEAILDTNLVNKDSGYLMGGILKDESSRLTGYFSNELYLRDRTEAILAIVEDLAYIARTQNFETVKDFQEIKSHKFVINGQLNSALVALEEILETMAADEFFAETVLAGAKGYLASKLDKYPGLTDIYMIYNGQTLSQDFAGLANVLEALSDLNVYAILSSNEEIPYERVDVVEAVLTEVFGLHYLSGDGRTEELVQGLEALLNLDLSSFEEMNLDLEGDAPKLVEMYKELLVIFEHPEYPFQYVNDFKTKQMPSSLVISKFFLRAAYEAYKDLKVTTIYEETDGAILVVLFPLAKIALPEYYEALNIDNCSRGELVEDAVAIMAMVERLQASDLIDVLRNHAASIDFSSAVADIEFLMDNALQLHILANGALEAVAELVLRDVVYGRTYFGIYFPEGAFELSEVRAADDAELIKQIMAQVVVVLENSSIDSLSEIKAHMNMAGAKQILADKVNLEAIANIMELVSEMTFVQTNANSLWNNFVLPKLEGTRLERFAKYEGATNEQLVEDLYLGSQIVRVLNALGIVDVYHGADINYAQAAEVEELLTLVSELNYFELNHERIYNFIAKRVEARGGVMFGIEEFTLANDIKVAAKVYEAVLPILTDARFPYTKLSQYLDVLRTRNIPGKKLMVEIAYDHKDAVLDAYHVVREEGLGKYALVLALPALNAVLPDYYQALNLEGYTFEDLRNDARIALDIAQRARHSQLLDVLRDRGQAVVDYSKALEDVEYMMNKALEMKIIGNDSLEKLATLTLEKYIYGKSVAGIEIYDCHLDFSSVDAHADAEVLVDMASEVIAILNNMGITTLGEVKALVSKAGVKQVLANEVNLEHIANIMELASEMTFVQANASNVWEYFVSPNLATSRLAQYARFANYDGATNEQLVEDLYLGSQIVRVLNALGIVDVYHGADINYAQAAEVEELLTLVSELNYFELNHERIYNFIAKRVEARGGVMFGIEEFTLANDIKVAAKVYEAVLPILTDARFPYTKLSQYLDVLRTRNIPGKKLMVEIAYDHKDAVLDAYHVVREEGLGKYALVLALPALNAVLPDYYQALNLEGYTFEDLRNDARIALDIAQRARHSQLLDVLRDRGQAVVDYSKALEDVEYMMNKALEMKIIGNDSLEKLATLTLEKYIYGKSVAGIEIYDCHLDFSSVDAHADAEVLVDMASEVIAILNNMGITTLGEVKALVSKAGVKQVLANEVNLEHIANIMELASEMTFVQENATNVWHLVVLPRLEARNLDRFVSYRGASSQELVEDLAVGAQIVRALNGLGIVDAYNGAAINYDQASEVKELLALIASLNYLEIDKEVIFEFIASKVSALYTYNASPEDLQIAADLIQLGEVYEAALPILTSPEYPFTTLKQYLDILRTRNVSGKAAVVEAVLANLQPAVNTYSEIVKLDSVKYVVLGGYNRVSAMGVLSSFVSLLDPSALSLAQIKYDLIKSAELAQLIAIESGLKFGIKENAGKKELGILTSSEINYDTLKEILSVLGSFYSLEGDLDAIVDIVAGKVGLSLAGDYEYASEYVFLHHSITYLEAILAELDAENLGDILAIYENKEETVEKVMKDKDIQNILVNYINVSKNYELGRDLVKAGYTQLVQPALPAQYQDLINFEDPSYVPALWAHDFENMFSIYNALEEINFGKPEFNPTLQEVTDLFELVFIIDTPHSIKANPQQWIEDVIYDNFPTVGAFEHECDEVTNWPVEISSIKNVLDSFVIAFGADKELMSLSSDDFRNVNNFYKLNTMLDAITDTTSMRTLVLAMLDEAIASSSSNSAVIDVADLISAEVNAQITPSGYAYNEAFWTADAIASLAQFIALSSEVFFDEFGNFDQDALDITNPEVLGDYYTGAFDGAGDIRSNLVGIGHILLVAADSTVFTTDAIGGADGVIASQMTSFVSDVTVIGEIENPQDVIELLEAIKAISAATDGNLNAYGINYVYQNITSPETTSMISRIQESDVLGKALPYILHDVVCNAAADKGVSEAQAFMALEAINADIADALQNPNPSNYHVTLQANPADIVAAINMLQMVL